MELCNNEGILYVCYLFSYVVDVILTAHRFTVYPRARREMMDFKVKSVLRGTEHDGIFNVDLY